MIPRSSHRISVQTSSTDSLMDVSKKQDESTQETQPKKGDPVEIPVPSKTQVVRDFEKIVTPEPSEPNDK